MGISVLTKRLKLDHKDWILRGFWDTTRVGESGYQRFNNKLNTWEIVSALLWSMKTEVDTKKMKWTDTKESKKKTFWLAVLESCRGHFVRWACKWWWSWEVIKGKTGIWFVIIKYNYSFTTIIVLGFLVFHSKNIKFGLPSLNQVGWNPIYCPKSRQRNLMTSQLLQ